MCNDISLHVQTCLSALNLSMCEAPKAAARPLAKAGIISVFIKDEAYPFLLVGFIYESKGGSSGMITAWWVLTLESILFRRASRSAMMNLIVYVFPAM